MDDIKYYVDFDDTIAFSKQAIVRILNDRFKTNIVAEEVKRWDFSDVFSSVGKSGIVDLFESDEFWNSVEINRYAINVLSKRNVCICSCGTNENLRKKREFIKKNFPGFKMFFTEKGVDRKMLDMSDGIHIDDVSENLIETNAYKKILLKNHVDVYWNQVPVNSEVYVANDWNEIEEMIDWWEYCERNCIKFN